MPVNHSGAQSMPPGQPLILRDLVQHADGAVVSRTIMKGAAGTLTLFAFDAGQGLSEHTAPFDALVQMLEGEADIRVGGVSHRLREGECILMPANVPHALEGVGRFRMLLTMLRS